MVEQDRGLNTDKLIYMPFNQVTETRGTCHPYRNAWWTCHPEKGLAFYVGDRKKRRTLDQASPQCNMVENTARLLQKKLWPEHEVRQIPLVLVPVDMRDYND